MQPTAEQFQQYRDTGVVFCPGLIPESLIRPARERVYQLLEAAGLWIDGRWTAPREADYKRPNNLKQLKNARIMTNLLTDEVRELASALGGGNGVQASPPLNQLLMTPPRPENTWRLPAQMWHLDYPRFGDLGPPGAQMFTFLDHVEPHGGGTLVATGSHHFFNTSGLIGSKEVKKMLQKKPWFRELMDKKDQGDRKRFFEPGVKSEGIPVRIIELTGAPGDVYFTDLRLLHSLGPNVSTRPRLMVTQRLPQVHIADRMKEDMLKLIHSRQKDKAKRAETAGNPEAHGA